VHSFSELTALAETALFLTIAVSLPAVVVAALVGAVVAAFQAATQLQDPTIAHLPRLIAVAAVIALFAPWMGQEITGFAVQALTGVR
jgi:type III secretion HrpO family protein